MNPSKTYLFSEAELQEVSTDIIRQLPKPAIVLLQGQMGAGKTTLIKQLCKVLGVQESVSSPTYSLVNEYKGTTHTIFHFDLYRLKDADELLQIGFEDYLYQNAYVFIEWPQLAENLLPENCIQLQLEVEADKRRLTINA